MVIAVREEPIGVGLHGAKKLPNIRGIVFPITQA